MNILILSCGTRDKLVRYFIENFKDIGNVICTDASNKAPALYEADNYYIVPKITDPNYLDIILNICKKEKIDAMLSLIDPELSLISKNKKMFLDNGIVPIVSDFESVDMSFDKMKMFRFCKENGINTINSYDDIELFKKDLDNKKINFPVFVKPYCGSCSVNIQKVNDLKKLESLFKEYDGLMIQEFMSGQEIGADVYIDSISHEIVSIFTKKKILMRAGETDKSVSFKDEKLFEFIKKFVLKAGYTFNIDIDIFEQDGKYFISEVNPRFGGGYLHAYECGCNFIRMIINNVNNKVNECLIGNYEEDIYMMKYLDVLIKKGL